MIIFLRGYEFINSGVYLFRWRMCRVYWVVFSRIKFFVIVRVVGCFIRGSEVRNFLFIEYRCKE